MLRITQTWQMNELVGGAGDVGTGDVQRKEGLRKDKTDCNKGQNWIKGTNQRYDFLCRLKEQYEERGRGGVHEAFRASRCYNGGK